MVKRRCEGKITKQWLDFARLLLFLTYVTRLSLSYKKEKALVEGEYGVKQRQRPNYDKTRQMIEKVSEAEERKVKGRGGGQRYKRQKRNDTLVQI